MAYDWPGNVRELINTLERALAAARHEPTLYPSHLPSHIRVKVARCAVSKEGFTKDEAPRAAPLLKLKDFREMAIARAEKQYLQDLMEITGNDIKEACRLSSLSMPRLYALLKKHGVNRTSTPVIGKE
jgi:two-component system, NtrC family, response regulator